MLLANPRGAETLIDGNFCCQIHYLGKPELNFRQMHQPALRCTELWRPKLHLKLRQASYPLLRPQ